VLEVAGELRVVEVCPSPSRRRIFALMREIACASVVAVFARPVIRDVSS
jgi:hypothetical protein